MKILKTAVISFGCIYLFHAAPAVKEFTLNFFSGMEQKLLPSDLRTDIFDTLIDTVEPTPTPTPAATHYE
jgi:hypothetical protein